MRILLDMLYELLLNFSMTLKIYFESNTQCSRGINVTDSIATRIFRRETFNLEKDLNFMDPHRSPISAKNASRRLVFISSLTCLKTKEHLRLSFVSW